MTSGKYMTRRKFYIPERERVKDYRKKGLPAPSEFLYEDEWGVIEDEED